MRIFKSLSLSIYTCIGVAWLLTLGATAADIRTYYRTFPQREYIYSADAVSNRINEAEIRMALNGSMVWSYLGSKTNSWDTASLFAVASATKTSAWDSAGAFITQPGFSSLTNSWTQGYAFANAANVKTQFWNMAWDFAFSAIPRTNQWDAAYYFYLNAYPRTNNWNWAYLSAVAVSQRTNDWDSATLFADTYLSHTAGWDWAASLGIPFASVSNLAANAATKTELAAVEEAVASLPTVAYIGSQDAQDRAYAYALFQAVTSGSSGAVTRVLDRYNTASSWMEYGSGAVWRVSVASTTNLYQWYISSSADISAAAATYYNAQRHPESALVLLGAEAPAALIGATNASLIQEEDVFYPTVAMANGGSTLGIVASPSAFSDPWIFPVFARDNPVTTDTHYSGPGINPTPYGESSSLVAFIAGSSAGASGVVAPAAITNMTFHTQASYYNDGIIRNTYTIGEAGAVLTVYRVTTSAPPVTNRVDLLAYVALSNSTLRVYDSGGGAWKFLLPGEEQP
jgi:hypothetical protein